MNLDLPDEVNGIKALRDIRARGPARHQSGIVLDQAEKCSGHAIWHDAHKYGEKSAT